MDTWASKWSPGYCRYLGTFEIIQFSLCNLTVSNRSGNIWLWHIQRTHELTCWTSNLPYVQFIRPIALPPLFPISLSGFREPRDKPYGHASRKAIRACTAKWQDTLPSLPDSYGIMAAIVCTYGYRHSCTSIARPLFHWRVLSWKLESWQKLPACDALSFAIVHVH